MASLDSPLQARDCFHHTPVEAFASQDNLVLLMKLLIGGRVKSLPTQGRVKYAHLLLCPCDKRSSYQFSRG